MQKLSIKRPITKCLMSIGKTFFFFSLMKTSTFRICQTFFNNEYAYDEYYDCYICPNNEVLSYSTTDKKGYKQTLSIVSFLKG